jgi:hypothetical protein
MAGKEQVVQQESPLLVKCTNARRHVRGTGNEAKSRARRETDPALRGNAQNF